MSLGLINVGNSCYINVILQIMFNTHMLDMILDDKYQDIKVFKYLRNIYFHRNREYITGFISYIQQQINKAEFDLSKQQDTMEFMNYLISIIHSQIKHIQYPYKQLATSHERINEYVNKKYENHIKDEGYSEIIETFQSFLLSQYSCIECKKIRYNYDVIHCVDVPLAEYNDNLEEFLDDLSENDVINDLYCSKCEKNTGCTKISVFAPIAPILFIRFKRYDNSLFRLNDTINIEHDIEVRDLNGYINYKLRAVVYHHGNSLSSGHYTVDINIDDYWYSYNDNIVIFMDDGPVCSKNVYILMYERC